MVPNKSSTIQVTHRQTDATVAQKVSSATRVCLFRRGIRIIAAVTDNSAVAGIMGEMGEQTLAALRAKARGQLLFFGPWRDDWSDRPNQLPIDALSSVDPMNASSLTAFWKDVQNLQKQGRGHSLSAPQVREVQHLAGFRCMYPGCGAKVDQIGPNRRAGNVGQLAHIVGADPKGPRGTDESHTLSVDPANYLLLCYDHHHLIDVVDPDGFSISYLREVRHSHLYKVEQLLDQLKWQRVQAIGICGGIAGQNSLLDHREMHDALAQRELSSMRDNPQLVFSNAPSERLDKGYGYHLLQTYQPSILRLISELREAGPLRQSDLPLAIFPLHDTPLLVLAGRLIGEARPVHVFQPDRGRDHTRWDWPASDDQHQAKVVEDLVKAVPKAQIGLLTIALSDNFQDTWLPSALRQQIDRGAATWLAVKADKPSRRIISSEKAFSTIMNTIRDAIQHLQGQHQVTAMHVILVAPASICFAFGQALQAGNHLPTTIYQRSDQSYPFQPAIRIEARRVVSADEDSRIPLEIALQ